MTDDFHLLDRYLAAHDQAAFRALVDQHLPLVFNLARRQFAGNASHAEDIAQSVFILLVRKAREHKIPRGKPLAAWLYQTTRYCCANLRRIEARRIRRESEVAMSIQAATELSSPTLDQAEFLSTALAALSEADRDMLLLRYSPAALPVPQIAAALNISPGAAEKRIARALEKLRAQFSHHPQPAGASIPALLVLHSIAAPADLPAHIATVATSAAPASSMALRLVANFSRTLPSLKAAVLLIAASTLTLAGLAAWHYAGTVPVAAAAPSATPLPVADPVPAFIPGPPPQRTYFANFSRNVLPQGLFDHTKENTLPAGWSASPDPFAAGVAAFNPLTQRLTLTSDAFEKKIELRTQIDLKPEWKRIVVRATLGSKNLRLNDSLNAAAGVLFVPEDKDGIQAGPAILLAADPKFGQWDKVLMATMDVPTEATRLTVLYRFSDAKGALRVQQIGVVPVDETLDLDPAKVYAFQTAVKNSDIQTITTMATADKRLLEGRNMQWDCGTPLIGAAWLGHTEVVQTLLDLGADVHATDDNGDAGGGHWTACTTAGYHGRTECFKLLFDRAPEKPAYIIPLIQWGMRIHTNPPANYQACLDYIATIYPNAATQQ